ncbi:MAG: four helix bundle protein [Flavobacteriales bacterium]|nr:four helix bundle protein [Flavobacteriales bacterium]
MGGFKDLVVYRKAFDMSKMVFRLSKRFPKEETYSLTDQVRRSSRSVTAQIAEGYRKRRYPLSFIAKMVDADGENAETQVWLDHAVACEYVAQADIVPIVSHSEEVGKLLADMIQHPAKYGAVENRRA